MQLKPRPHWLLQLPKTTTIVANVDRALYACPLDFETEENSKKSPEFNFTSPKTQFILVHYAVHFDEEQKPNTSIQASKAQTPLFRFVADLFHNKSATTERKLNNKSRTS